MATISTREWTIDDGLDGIGFGKFHVGMLILSGFAWMADAFEAMVLSFLGPSLRCDWGVTSAQESILTSIVFVGMMIGTYCWGWLGDRSGRKRGVMFSSVFTLLFGVASGLAPSYFWMVVFRGMVGFGIGGVPVAFSLFLELIPSESRGFWSIAMQVWWTVGTVVQGGLAYLVLPGLGWRWLLIISAAPLVVLITFFFFVPESSRFLQARGRSNEAQQVLAKIARINGKKLPPGRLKGATEDVPLGVRSEQESPFTAVADAADKTWTSSAEPALAPTKPKAVAALDIFRLIFSSSYIRTTLIVWFLWLTNAFVYYGFVLLATEFAVQDNEGCPDDGSAPLKASDYVDIIITSAAEFPGLLLSGLLVERMGRKYLQSLQFGIVGGCTWGLMIVVSRSKTIRQILLFIGRAMIMGAFATTYVYTPEVYPTNVRATASGIANCFGRIGGMIAPFIGQGLLEADQTEAAMAIFATMASLGGIACLFLTVETSGKSLDALEAGAGKASGGSKLHVSDQTEKTELVSGDALSQQHSYNQTGHHDDTSAKLASHEEGGTGTWDTAELSTPHKPKSPAAADKSDNAPTAAAATAADLSPSSGDEVRPEQRTGLLNSPPSAGSSVASSYGATQQDAVDDTPN